MNLELNGRQVHAFMIQASNLGFARLADLLNEMLRSNAWREFKDGLGTFNFLPGEFDYFLTQRGINRDDVIHGVRDLEVKAKLEKAMDERKTGESNYRRPIEQARAENPTIPARPIMPFGVTESESKYLKLKTRGNASAFHRTALGDRIRRGKRKVLPLIERLINSLQKLDDAHLDKFVDAAKREQQQRRRRKNIRLVG